MGAGPGSRRRFLLVLGMAGAVSMAATSVAAQPVPKPFPQAGGAAASQPGQKPPAPAPATPAPAPGVEPTEAMLGLPLYPASQYLASYDAGQGQRYFLFGTTAAFGEVVAYYRNALKQKGSLVFDQPPTYMFEVGRFREDTMAFPPGVTVKDFSWMPAGGYLNPRPGAQPGRFPTIIQVVPLSGSDGAAD